MSDPSYHGQVNNKPKGTVEGVDPNLSDVRPPLSKDDMIVSEEVVRFLGLTSPRRIIDTSAQE